jgi:hypothetical protein
MESQEQVSVIIALFKIKGKSKPVSQFDFSQDNPFLIPRHCKADFPGVAFFYCEKHVFPFIPFLTLSALEVDLMQAMDQMLHSKYLF